MLIGFGCYLALDRQGNIPTDVAAAPAVKVVRTQFDTPASAVVSGSSLVPAGSASAAHIEHAAAIAQDVGISSPAAIVAQAPAQLTLKSEPSSAPSNKIAQRGARVSTTRAPAAADVLKKKETATGRKYSAPKVRTVTTASARSTRTGSKAPESRARPKREEDADTELVAAIIARLDRHGPLPVASTPASSTALLAAQMSRCASKSDPLEARRCGYRACEGQWGKVDACPASRAPKLSRDNEVNGDGQHD
jgi:hypothetical protein